MGAILNCMVSQNIRAIRCQQRDIDMPYSGEGYWLIHTYFHNGRSRGVWCHYAAAIREQEKNFAIPPPEPTGWRYEYTSYFKVVAQMQLNHPRLDSSKCLTPNVLFRKHFGLTFAIAKLEKQK